MTHPYLADHLVTGRDRDVRAASARARLVALAKCCRPSRIAASVKALRQRLHPRGRATAACCA